MKFKAAFLSGLMPIPSSTGLDEDGNVRLSVGAQRDRWRRHFNHVLNIPSSFDESVVSIMGQCVVYASCSPPGAEDTHTALRAMSNGKSGDTLGIVPELLKSCGLCFRLALADLLRDVWTQSYAPHDWHHASLSQFLRRAIYASVIIGEGLHCLTLESFAAESLRISSDRLSRMRYPSRSVVSRWSWVSWCCILYSSGIRERL